MTDRLEAISDERPLLFLAAKRQDGPGGNVKAQKTGGVGSVKRKMTLIGHEPVMTAVSGPVAVEDQPVLSRSGRHRIVDMGPGGMKIKNKDHAGPLKSDDLVLVMLLEQPGPGAFQNPISLDQFDHVPVELAQKPVFQILGIGQAPLPARVPVRPVVSRPWKIDPFGMSELVSHEIQIPAARGRQGDETDQLVQGDAPVNAQAFMAYMHVFVDIRSDQPEDQGLIADQGLIVRFGVADGLLLRAPVVQLVPQSAHGPVFVGNVFDQTDPQVGNAHGEPVIKADSAPVL